MTFAMLINIFCPLGVKRKKPKLLLYQAGLYINLNLMKNTHLLYILFQVLKVLLIKIIKYNQLPFLSFLVVLHQQISFFTIFLELSFTYLKKIFLSQIFICQEIHSFPPPTLFNSQNLLSVTKCFVDAPLWGEANFLQALMAREYWEAFWN